MRPAARGRASGPNSSTTETSATRSGARARDLKVVTKLVITAPKIEMSRATNRAISERCACDHVSARFQWVLVSICCDEPPPRNVPRAGPYDRRHDPSRAHGKPSPATRSRRVIGVNYFCRVVLVVVVGDPRAHSSRDVLDMSAWHFTCQPGIRPRRRNAAMFPTIGTPALPKSRRAASV